VNASEAELTKLKSERFECTESLNAGVDMRLLSETVVSTPGVKFQRDLIVLYVMRWFFIVSTTYIFHIFFVSDRTFRGQANACRMRQKEDMV